MKRLILLIGLGIGYVLGSKAGREQYRKIKTTASKTWQSPAVRNAAEKVEAFVGEKAPALGGVAHTVLGGSGNGSSTGGTSSTPSGNGTSSTSPSGSSYTAPGAGSTDTGFSETGSNTAGSTLGGPVSDADLKLDTDLGTEGERPA